MEDHAYDVPPRRKRKDYRFPENSRLNYDIEYLMDIIDEITLEEATVLADDSVYEFRKTIRGARYMVPVRLKRDSSEYEVRSLYPEGGKGITAITGTGDRVEVP